MEKMLDGIQVSERSDISSQNFEFPVLSTQFRLSGSDISLEDFKFENSKVYQSLKVPVYKESGLCH